MGDYTNMSSYYDVIMTSGYYDYVQIVDDLERHGPFANILEIGCGTGNPTRTDIIWRFDTNAPALGSGN